MNYAQARRHARSNFGELAEVEFLPKTPYPYRVGIRLKGTVCYLGAGDSWEAAFTDAEQRRRTGEYLSIKDGV